MRRKAGARTAAPGAARPMRPVSGQDMDRGPTSHDTHSVRRTLPRGDRGMRGRGARARPRECRLAARTHGLGMLLRVVTVTSALRVLAPRGHGAAGRLRMGDVAACAIPASQGCERDHRPVRRVRTPQWSRRRFTPGASTRAPVRRTAADARRLAGGAGKESAVGLSVGTRCLGIASHASATRQTPSARRISPRGTRSVSVPNPHPPHLPRSPIAWSH